MSLNLSGEKCAVCHAYLFDDDDIVYCPECGAPHHRECYEHIGHCGLQEYHGTEQQYTRPALQDTNNTEQQPVDKKTAPDGETVCGMCGETYSKNSAVCPKCGAPNIERMGGRFVNFDFLGGVPADMDLGSGVTAEEAKQFVGANTQRYIPKFASFKAGKKSSWNWLAFLTPCGWFLSRKMYAFGAFMGALQVAFQMLRIPFMNAASHFDFSDANNYMEMSEIIVQYISDIGLTALIVAFAGVILNLILHILSAVFGDVKYKGHVISAVSKIKKSSDDIDSDMRKRGGVSFIWALVGIMAVEYLPSIISTFIGII